MLCQLSIVFVSMNNMKAYATLVTEHISIVAVYCYIVFLLLNNVISVNTVNVIFVSSAKQ